MLNYLLDSRKYLTSFWSNEIMFQKAQHQLVLADYTHTLCLESLESSWQNDFCFCFRLRKRLSTHRRRQDLLHYLCPAWDPTLWVPVGWSGRSAGNHIWQRNRQSGKDVCGKCFIKCSENHLAKLTELVLLTGYS